MQTIDSTCQIFALAVTPATRRLPAGSLFIAREDGLYHSQDGGKTWAYAFRSLFGDQPLPALAMALSPDFAHDDTLLVGAPGAILFSRDGGENWQVTRLDAPAPLVCGVAFSPDYTQDGTLFAITTDDGVFCSYDAGSTWVSWNFGLMDPNGTCLVVSPDFSQNRAVFAGTSTGLFRSANGGKSWHPLDLPVEDQPVYSLAIQALDGGSLRLLAGTASAGLLASFDSGLTWEVVAPDLEGRSVDGLCSLPGKQGLAALVEQELLLSSGPGKPFQPWPAGLPEGSQVAAVGCVPGVRQGVSIAAALTGGEIVALRLK